MADYFEVQTMAEVNEIDFKRNIQDNVLEQQQIQQQEIIDTIEQKIDELNDNITSGIDLSEITTVLNEIDTNVISAQTNDLIGIIQKQQSQINSIEAKIDKILKKTVN